jgi:arginine decarboxylase
LDDLIGFSEGIPESYRADVGHWPIVVTAGVGEGATELSAFDAALWECGVQDYNHIALSSVIPPRSQVVRCPRYDPPDHEYGQRLYVVKADMRSADRGAVIAAGLGWWQWGDGRGVFVEHALRSRNQSAPAVEGELARQITSSLGDLAHRRGVPFVPEHAGMQIVSTMVAAMPACALVLAVFEAAAWARHRIRREGGQA